MGADIQFERLDVQVDYPGYRDELIRIDIGPQRQAVQRVVVEEKRFGRWRAGFRGPWRANQNFIHVAQSPLKPGMHTAVTS